MKVKRMTTPITDIIDQHLQVVEQLKSLSDSIHQVAQLILNAFKQGNKLLLCGNGGSAADAQHIAAEFTGRYQKEREPLPALALHTNISAITATGNDYSYDQIYEREVKAHGKKGDILIAISTSGQSKNILLAVQAAKERNLTTIGFTGQKGGKLKELCDLSLCVPSDFTPRIQESHILIGHILCELVEDACD